MLYTCFMCIFYLIIYFRFSLTIIFNLVISNKILFFPTFSLFYILSRLFSFNLLTIAVLRFFTYWSLSLSLTARRTSLLFAEVRRQYLQVVKLQTALINTREFS